MFKKILESKVSTLSNHLSKNIQMFKDIFVNDDTLRIHEFVNQYDPSIRCCILFIDGMVNEKMISESIIHPIITIKLHDINNHLVEKLKQEVLFSNQIKSITSIEEMIDAILSGDTLLLIDNYKESLTLSSKGYQLRGISEPESEKSLYGPREGFNENLIVNLSLIRRKIRNNKLKFIMNTMGSVTNTKLCLCYIEGIANDQIIEELKLRLEKIKIDSVLDINYISEYIKDSPLSLFKTTGETEKPDIVAAKLLEGRIALFVDGTPMVMTIPYIFVENFQSADDYYLNFYFSSVIRALRVIGFLLTISVPAIFLSLVTFHQAFIPTPLLLSMYSARKSIPLPTVVELVGLLIVFQILREAGTRMPTYIGQAISIVGALVLGQAAVEAKLVSAPIVIIVAFTGITSLMIPKLTGAIIIIRFLFIFTSSIIGIYGYIFGMAAMMIHLFSLRSFGVPYMQDINSLKMIDLKDTSIRAPIWYQKRRENIFHVAKEKK